MTESILDHPLITERYFFPRADRFEDPFWVDAGEARLGCFLHGKHPGGRTVVHFHGNGEIVSDYMNGFVSVIHGMGCNCLLAEYRGYGMSTGRPALAGMLEDVRAIVTALGEPPENLVLFGRSLGSVYALHGAHLFPGIAGLIIESGLADPLERILVRVHPEELGVGREAVAAAVARDLDHRKKIESYHGPLLVMHTRFDGLLDLSHARRLHAWAPGPKKLEVFDQGDHNSIMLFNREEYFQLVRDFISGL